MKWITRERPKIDRIACPWLIERFIDKEPKSTFYPYRSVFWLRSATLPVLCHFSGDGGLSGDSRGSKKSLLSLASKNRVEGVQEA